VSASPLKIPAESLYNKDAEGEDDGEYCEESWQRLKGGTIMSGETLVEKLDEEVCYRVCHPDVTFPENVNCKSCVSSFLVTQLLAFVTGHSLLDLEPSTGQLLRGFQQYLPFAFTFVFRVPEA